MGHIYVKYTNTGHPRTYRLCVGMARGLHHRKALGRAPGAGEVPSQSLSPDCGRAASTQWSSFPCSYMISVFFCTRYPLRARVHAQSLSPVRLCNPMHCSPPGSSVHGILQARTPEWVAMTSSRGSSQPRDRTAVSCIGRQTLLSRQ